MKGLKTYYKYILIESIDVDETTEAGIILPKSEVLNRKRNINQNQKVVHVSEELYKDDPKLDIREGDTIRIRRDSFVPEIEVCGKKYEQVSIYQVICKIDPDLAEKHNKSKISNNIHNVSVSDIKTFGK